MKILVVSNRVRTYSLGFKNEIEPFLSLGHEVIWAADFNNFIGDKDSIPCRISQIDIVSYPFHLTNFKAFFQIKRIIEDEEIDVVECSTPIGGTLARLAAWHCGIKKVIYVAHGFLFFKGSPAISHAIYKFHEKMLAKITDTLVTITEEDFEEAKKFKIRGGRQPYRIHGAGVIVGVKVVIDKKEKRKELGLPDNCIAMISAGDLNSNKNNEIVIKALGVLHDNSIHYLVCGLGDKMDYLKQLSQKLNISSNIHFLGYRTDMPELLSCSDIFVMPSFREGVPRSLLEAMDLGLPCVGSDTRGIRDLIENGKGGFICHPKKETEFAKAIKSLAKDDGQRKLFGEYNKGKSKKYSSEVVWKETVEIYQEALNNSK